MIVERVAIVMLGFGSNVPQREEGGREEEEGRDRQTDRQTETESYSLLYFIITHV